MNDKEIIESLLDGTGITLNGNKSYDLQVHNEDTYARILREGSMGLGESYMEGWWDCERLDQFFDRIIRADLNSKAKKNWRVFSRLALRSALYMGKKARAYEVGEKHYDVGNELYQAMLDKRLTYTCGYWKEAKNLDEAQEAKLDLVCQKIGLKKGQTVLDIGSGWGSFTGFAAEKYGAKALGVTISKEQKNLADKLYKELPVKTKLQDYRDISGQFDHVVSLGMIEHVGSRNYRQFMEVVHRSLSDDGLFLLHTIGGNRSAMATEPWFEKYIFPNSVLPSIKQLSKAFEGLFVMEDWQNFGADYDKTLMQWHKNFEASWDGIKDNYSEEFYRMWRYYLLASAGTFRSRKNQLWQIVLSKKGIGGGYKSIR